jgi:hypothetical protein
MYWILIWKSLLSRAAVSYFLIPFGVMLISWAVQRSFKLRLSAGTELFAFGFALDLDLLYDQRYVATRINPAFRDSFDSIFTVALLVSLWFLIHASSVQSQIGKRGGKRYYPYIQVALCWVFAIAVIGFHLFAVLGI